MEKHIRAKYVILCTLNKEKKRNYTKNIKYLTGQDLLLESVKTRKLLIGLGGCDDSLSKTSLT